MGMPDARPVKQMLDSELLNILPNLSSDEDRAWAVLARYHGCRMAELAFAENCYGGGYCLLQHQRDRRIGVVTEDGRGHTVSPHT